MSACARVAAMALACGALNGCVAAIAPIVAAGAVGGRQVLGRDGDRAEVSKPREASVTAPPSRVAVAPVSVTAPAPTAPAAAPPVAAPPVLPTHDWRAMVVHVADAVQATARPADGVVAAPGATRFLPCGTKPFAVIVDAEGTVLPPVGAPRGATVRTDEAVRAFGDLRFGRVTVIFTSDRPAAETAATEAALERARLGPAMQGRELLSVGDAPAGTSKAALRAAVAAQYCVLALVGDAPEDFGDLPVAGRGSAPWGAGWFRIPAAMVTP